MEVVLKQNGKITFFGHWVGNWGYEDVWASQGKYNASGCRLAKCFYHAWLINGEHIYFYTRKELKDAIINRFMEIVGLAKRTNDEQKQAGINGIKIDATITQPPR